MLFRSEKIAADPQRFARVCLVVDARDGDPSRTIELVRTGAASIGVSARIIYLDARDDVLIRRFSETRHRHPLGGAVDAPRSVAEAIAAERRLLSATREAADAVIDTSDLSGRELRDRLVAEALESEERVAIRLTSFGYKHGIPLEADLVFDVRAAANPHWVPELRPLDGRSKEISDFVLGDPTGAALMQSIERYLDFVLLLMVATALAFQLPVLQLSPRLPVLPLPCPPTSSCQLSSRRVCHSLQLSWPCCSPSTSSPLLA